MNSIKAESIDTKTAPHALIEGKKTNPQEIQLQQEMLRKFMSQMVYGTQQTQAEYKRKATCPDICAVQKHIDGIDLKKNPHEHSKLSQYLDSVCEDYCKRMKTVAA